MGACACASSEEPSTGHRTKSGGGRVVWVHSRRPAAKESAPFSLVADASLMSPRSRARKMFSRSNTLKRPVSAEDIDERVDHDRAIPYIDSKTKTSPSEVTKTSVPTFGRLSTISTTKTSHTKVSSMKRNSSQRTMKGTTSSLFIQRASSQYSSPKDSGSSFFPRPCTT
mmetsp:Transcript_4524/g.6769  ORF Transcript_4524/g.6769 Transcript_4524/m.6769 type:complete len:169 (+) Transcript_4524:32-538(+)